MKPGGLSLQMETERNQAMSIETITETDDVSVYKGSGRVLCTRSQGRGSRKTQGAPLPMVAGGLLGSHARVSIINHTGDRPSLRLTATYSPDSIPGVLRSR